MADDTTIVLTAEGGIRIGQKDMTVAEIITAVTKFHALQHEKQELLTALERAQDLYKTTATEDARTLAEKNRILTERNARLENLFETMNIPL